MAKQNSFDDFTEAHYRTILTAAIDRYEFESFGAESTARHALWRHDVDLSVHRAVSLAEIEASMGVRSTYFLLLHSEFYNLLEADVVGLARRLPKFGHWVGLHFDPALYGSPLDDDVLVGALDTERNLLEEIVEAPVRCFSFHNPELANVLSVDVDLVAGMVNAYGKTTRANYTYVSDSNGYWRFDRLLDVVEAAPPRLHTLTHPGWWQREAMAPRQRVERCVSGRASATLAHYAAILRAGGREDVGADETR